MFSKQLIRSMGFFEVDFGQVSQIPDALSWKIGAVPGSVSLKENGLAVVPNFETDFWRNTYYDPILQAYNGHVLGVDTSEAMFLIEAHCSFQPAVKFDQAGLFLGQDEATWLKAGVEFAEGATWLSVVVTRNDYSDWSKSSIPWTGKDLYIRVYREKGTSYVVEASEDGVTYVFVRIAHLPTTGSVTAGMMTCRPPKDENQIGAAQPPVNFHKFRFAENPGYHHNNN